MDAVWSVRCYWLAGFVASPGASRLSPWQALAVIPLVVKTTAFCRLL
jgi:hypothetical protein